ncbi:MAG: hypothetical protein ACI9MC_004305, partial [Kiritimatiellia bacterium]
LYGLIDDRNRQVALQALSFGASAQEAVDAHLATIDARIADLLTTWTSAGGHLRFATNVASPPIDSEQPNLTRPAPQRHTQGRATRDEALSAVRQVASQTLRVPISDPNWRSKFEALLHSLGPAATDEQEADRLANAAMTTDAWFGWPAHVQKRLIGMIATRLRALQASGMSEDNRFKQAFSSLSAFSKREKPGFVFGLSRSHTPHGESWFADSERHREHLLALLPAPDEDTPSQRKLLADLRFLSREVNEAPIDQRDELTDQAVRTASRALDSGLDSRDGRLIALMVPMAKHLIGPQFRRLRRAIREQITSQHESNNTDTPTVTDDWAWSTHTRGRRVALVGDDAKDANISSLEVSFDFADVQIVANSTHLRELSASIQKGGVDLVIIVGEHVEAQIDQIILPACRKASTPWVLANQGAEVTPIKHAIERFLDPIPLRTQGSQGAAISV